ncbi:MAG: flippase-like domain-containing protein [Calditrichaeota bacterium]|nr:flippase-like domain-containing protein [Calditrichota bacterium]MCB9366857.1 flippase-like domain-containing protein [Calditrichota bacterium]
MNKKFSRILLSLAISGFFLYLTAFKPKFGALFSGKMGVGEALFGYPRFNLSELGAAISNAEWNYVLVAGVIFFTTLFIRAWRWQLTLNTLTKIKLMPTFGTMTIGYMANNLLPMRLGEVYRAQVINQLTGMSRSAAFGTIVAERLIDLVYMVPYIGAALLIYPLPDKLRSGAYVLSAAAFVLGGFCIWLGVDRTRALKWAGVVLKIFPKKLGDSIHSLLSTFSAGLGVMGRKELAWQLAISSLILWAMYAFMVYLIMAAIGLTKPEFPMIHNDLVGSVLVMLVVTTIGFVIPGAPGSVGTYHGVAVLGLSLFNVPGDRAAAFAVMLHALNYLPLTLLGLAFFWKYGLSFHSPAEGDIAEATAGGVEAVGGRPS